MTRSPLLSAFKLAPLALLLASCSSNNQPVTECTAGTQGCSCLSDGLCNDGLSCRDGVCGVAACEAGNVGCPCDAQGGCKPGATCKSGSCTACSNGVVGCPCAAGACLGGLVCDAASTLCWEAKSCAQTSCAPHQKCGSEAGEDAVCLPECMPGFLWLEAAAACEETIEANCDGAIPGSILADCQALHRSCIPTASGAECGECEIGFVDENSALDACRPLRTCLDEGCAAAHRACTEATASRDASCGGCLPEYQLEGETCVELPVGSCVEGNPLSIVDSCVAEHRTCVEPVAGRAFCGDCLSGFELQGAACTPISNWCITTCAQLNRTCDLSGACAACLPGFVAEGGPDSTCLPRCGAGTCAANQFCMAGSCADAPCASNQAKREDTGQCVTCGGLCNGEGETGRWFPFTMAESNRCMCETRPGFYYDDSNAAAMPCDADGDGWVRNSARSAVESRDPAFSSNARCEVRTIDRVVLRNEYLETRVVDLVVEGIAAAPVPLYETVRNDSQSDLDARTPAWAQGTNGRRLRAAEVNPFTKACMTKLADLNDNQVADVDEWQGMTTSQAAVFGAFSYFLELHDAAYVPPAVGERHGSYLIAERSRCGALELGYAAGASDYWKNCTRKRDWNQSDVDHVGADFGRWSPATTPSPLVAPPSDGTLPAHGLCEVSLPPGDNLWRGMNHHSQFKCVVVTSAMPSDPTAAKSRRLRPDLMPNGREQFNRCHVDCATGNFAGCPNSSLEPAGETSVARPALSCEPVTASALVDDEAGFTSYQWAPGAYVRGCITESEEPAYQALCPGYLANPMGTVTEPDPTRFGALVCGCGLHLGGETCDVGCPASDTFFTDGYSPTTRQGYWMCSHPVASQPTPLMQTEGDPASGYHVTGHIPARIVTIGTQEADPSASRHYSVH